MFALQVILTFLANVLHNNTGLFDSSFVHHLAGYAVEQYDHYDKRSSGFCCSATAANTYRHTGDRR